MSLDFDSCREPMLMPSKPNAVQLDNGVLLAILRSSSALLASELTDLRQREQAKRIQHILDVMAGRESFEEIARRVN